MLPDLCVILERMAHGHLLVDSHSGCDEEAGRCMWPGQLNFWGQISTFPESDVIKNC
jgi:hypothetical protein